MSDHVMCMRLECNYNNENDHSPVLSSSYISTSKPSSWCSTSSMSRWGLLGGRLERLIGMGGAFGGLTGWGRMKVRWVCYWAVTWHTSTQGSGSFTPTCSLDVVPTMGANVCDDTVSVPCAGDRPSL